MASWLSEFKRRNVFKVGVAYLIVAWVLIQIAETVAPQLNLPEWAPRLITLIVLLGFPLALVLAWIFDLTPEGIKAESGTGKDKGIYIIAGALLVGVIGWYAWDNKKPTTSSSETLSIAVLPFANISGDPENEYFSDGISEELLNALARNPALRVAARTSSFAFRDQQMEVPDIARELNVQAVLEGSVRRQGDQVRITAQLIDAESGFHLWSETYDRNLKDIFATQDDISAAITSALEIELAAPNRHPKIIRTAVPATYDNYLRAKALWTIRRPAELRQAANMLEAVIAADPEFAEAYATLALIYAVMPFYTQDPRAELHVKARNAAEYALALDPEIPEAYGALGDLAIHSQQYDLADALLRRAIEVSPSFPPGHYWLAEKYFYLGELENAINEHEIARQLDPRSAAGGFLRAMAYVALERPEDARATCASILDSAPEHESCLSGLLIIALGQKDIELARNLLISNPNIKDDDQRQFAQSIADALVDDSKKPAMAQKLLDLPHYAIFDPAHPSTVHDGGLPALILALGEPELALERLKLNAINGPNNVQNVLWDPQLDPIRCEEGFQQVVKQLKVSDERAERVCKK